MIERMASEITKLKREPQTDSASRLGIESEVHIHAAIPPAHGLSYHVRQLRRRNRGISRWFGFAVILGAVMAFAFVGFFAR
jgi:hypothetical protein